jgi:D-amino-acid oxidase
MTGPRHFQPLPTHRPPLIFGRDFTTSPQPLKNPGNLTTSPHVLVIGSGVSGCTTAWLLLDRGYRVTILAQDFPSFQPNGHGRITSQVGAALWEFPSPPCGPQLEPANATKVRQWALESYLIYQALAAHDTGLKTTAGLPDFDAGKQPNYKSNATKSKVSRGEEAFGVRMRRSVALYPFRADDYPPERERLAAMTAAAAQEVIEGFRRDVQNDIVDEFKSFQSAAIGESNNEDEYEEEDETDERLRNWHGHAIIDAMECQSPVIDTDQAMLFLISLLQAKGAHFIQETLTDSLADVEEELCARFKADVIVNASGLGARELAADEALVGARGAMLRVLNDGLFFPKLDVAVVVNSIWKDDHDVVYFVPRNEGVLLIGNFLEEEEGHEKVGKVKSSKYDVKLKKDKELGKEDKKAIQDSKKDSKKDKNDWDMKAKKDFREKDEYDGKAFWEKSNNKKVLMDQSKQDDASEMKLSDYTVKKKKKKSTSEEAVPKKRLPILHTQQEGKKGGKSITDNDYISKNSLSLSSPPVLALTARSEAFAPRLLDQARLDPVYPLAQAWRPVRRGDVRVERDTTESKEAKLKAKVKGKEEKKSKKKNQSRIVHAYGHGVYGWTVAFGSAAEAAWIVDKVLRDVGLVGGTQQQRSVEMGRKDLNKGLPLQMEAKVKAKL